MIAPAVIKTLDGGATVKRLEEIFQELMETGKFSLNDYLEVTRAMIVMNYWNSVLSDHPEEEIERYRRTLPNLRRMVGDEPTVQTLKNTLNRNGIDTSNIKDEEE